MPLRPAFLAAAAILLVSPANAAFDITLSFSGTTTAEQQQYFNDAATYWESVISGYKSGVTLTGLSISADITAIDGVGGTLGSAGPNGLSTRLGTVYVTTGSMRFDSADVANMISNGTFSSVIRHEMGHVLGIGTLWDNNSLYTAGSGNYTGATALAAWKSEFSRATDTAVPVELSGGSGTADGHWNENDGGGGATGIVSKYSAQDMRYELMTGWASSSSFTSSITQGSLVDLGYTIAVPTDGFGNYAITEGRVFSQLAGTKSLSKTGTGGAGLYLANTYSGGTTVSDGTLYIEHAQALGTGSVTVAGGTLDLGNYDGAGVAVTGIGAFTLQSGTVAGAAGSLNAASFNLQSGTVAAKLVGTGALMKTTAGTVTLSGANSYSGATSVQAGTLLISGGSLGDTAITVSSGAKFGGDGSLGTGSASLTLNTGATLLASTTSHLALNGSLTAASGSFLDLTDLATAGSTYTLLTYTGAASGLNNL